MKELFEHNGMTIAIYDDNNYVLFDKRKSVRKYEYFSDLRHCVLGCSRRVANEVALDLSEWLKVHAEVSELALTQQ
jgi:hypothetical protein